jgi:hypothetical protein
MMTDDHGEDGGHSDKPSLVKGDWSRQRNGENRPAVFAQVSRFF